MINAKKTGSIGRANIVLVFGHGNDPIAVITSVTARISNQKREERICFTGPATFDKKTAKHITDVVLDTVDNVLSDLGLPQGHFDISAVNLGAASINNLGTNISRFSADTSLFLAMLSAKLEIPIPQNLLCTGHIASPDGDIRMVKGIPAKLNAACSDKSINTFIHPATDLDSSLDALSPKETKDIFTSLIKAKQDIRTIAVRDVAELIETVFSEEDIVLSSLRKNYYTISAPPSPRQMPTGRTTLYLTLNNEERLWKTLERQLLEGRNKDAKRLLLALTEFHTRNRTYPTDLGYRLLRLIQSLPPGTRRLKLTFPLLSISNCIKISQFAKDSDQKDVPLLFKATSGETVRKPLEEKETGANHRNSRDPENDRLHYIISEINADALTMIGIPIDSARASYLMESVTVDTYDEFIETLTSFYMHLLRHNRVVSDPVDQNAAGAEAFSLIERAFSKKGGFKDALSEGRHASRGGIRYVLDKMTAQLKIEEQEKKVNHVLKTALDPLDWQGKVDIIRDLMKRLGPHLPTEITSQPPERFAVHHELLVKLYVQSIDHVKSIFRSL